MTMFAPALAKAMEVARPIPVSAPVIKTTWFDIKCSYSFVRLIFVGQMHPVSLADTSLIPWGDEGHGTKQIGGFSQRSCLHPLGWRRQSCTKHLPKPQRRSRERSPPVLRDV